VRRGDWKLVLDTREGTEELFDLAADPYERNDRAAAEPALVAELRLLVEENHRLDDTDVRPLAPAVPRQSADTDP
jgi:arylsulfatase A-like enzyme